MDNTKHMSPFADTAFKRFFGQCYHSRRFVRLGEW
jgi:hypothetical protein